MKFRIHNEKFNDSLVVEGDTVEECRDQSRLQESKRGWKMIDCWSEKLEGE